jgi:PDZ domain-containing secreted protein
MRQKKTNWRTLFLIIFTLAMGGLVVLFLSQKPGEEPLPDKIVEVSGFQEIVDGKHVATGLIADEGLNLVIAHCTGCHSAKLVTQNRFNKEGWTRVIRWMQETQNLWDLGESEEAIVEYLSKHYAPEFAGRRMPLTEMEWYELKEE